MTRGVPMKATKSKQKELSIATWLKVILCAWCFIFIIGFAKAAIAEELTSTEASNTQTDKAQTNKTHFTIGGLVKQQQVLSNSDKHALLLKSEKQLLTSTITREQHQAAKLKDSNQGNTKAKSSNIITLTPRSLYHDFSVYDGYSVLFDDLDYDGFYQTFSVIFDADVHTYAGADQAAIYAEIYLSRNGGPWEYLHTTDSFTIYGESTEDEYEVMTNLATGYPSDYYDVLIDVYEVGYSDIVATYSSDDTNNLYALPLESNNYDVVEYYEEHHAHGGSSSTLLLSLIVLALALRHSSKILLSRTVKV